jgi:hypothetical protein
MASIQENTGGFAHYYSCSELQETTIPALEAVKAQSLVGPHATQGPGKVES